MSANPVTDNDRDFAEFAISRAVAEPDPELAAYLLWIADQYDPPSAYRCSAGVRLAMAGLGRQESTT